MNYKTFNVAAVAVLAVSSVFLGAVFFWPDSPKNADASVPATVASQGSSSKPVAVSEPAVLAQKDNPDIDQVQEAVAYAEDYAALNTLNEFPVIEISSDNSSGSSNYASSPTITDDTSGSFSFDISTLSSSGGSSGSSEATASLASGGSSGGGGGGASSGESSSDGTSETGDTSATGSDNSNSGTMPNTGGNTSGGGVSHNASVLVLPAYERILQNNYSVSGGSSVQIFCARNETESFQLLVSNKSAYALSDIEIVVSQWDTEGSLARSPKITLYREHYVEVKKSSHRINSQLGMYPDALIPFIDPYTNQSLVSAQYLADHQTIASKSSQGYWADITVGSDVPAGTYTCSILVTSSDNPIAEIPVTLNVWDFTLPVRPAWTAWFCDVRPEINIAYGLSRNTSAYKEILLRHQDILYEHGIYPSFQINHPVRNDDTGDVIFTKDYTDGLKAFINKYGARTLCLPGVFADQPQKFKNFVMAYNAFSQANPWAGQFFYYLDEPDSPEAYNRVRQCGEIIDAFAPSIKLLVTVMDISSASLNSVDNLIDIKVPLFKEATAAKIQSYRRDGQTLWAYNALHQAGPCWLLDANLANYRIPAWSSYILGIEGILYWQTTVWASSNNGRPSFNPWLSQESHFSKNGLQMWNGEGSLLYPGTQAGIRGPVASMRLKVFRDSVEDYAYFKLLESKVGKTQAMSQVSAVTTDFLTYDNDPESYIAQRKAIAELILH